MATSVNSEKQCRTVLLLTRASTIMLKGIVLDCVSKSPQRASLDDWLQANRRKITHFQNGKRRDIHHFEEILFPPFATTDIDKWELNVLCFIVMDVCTTVDPKIGNNVEDLKSMRDKLFHTAEMSNDDYDQCRDQIEDMVLTCCRVLGDVGLTEKVEAAITNMKNDPLSIGECMRTQRMLYEWDRQISDKLDHLSQETAEINGKLNFIIENMCPDLKPGSMQFEIQVTDSRRTREICKVLVDMINAYMYKKEMEQRTSEMQEQSSNEPSRLDTQSDAQETIEPNMANVKQRLEHVLGEFCQDRTVIIKCYKRSIHLVFQCSSFENLQNKVRQCLEGKTTQLFLPVQEALRQLEGCENLTLEVMTRKSWYRECILKTVEHLEERLHGAPETVDTSLPAAPADGDGQQTSSVYLSVASMSHTALIELQNRASSEEMKQNLDGLTQALKKHFGIENLSIEIKVHESTVPEFDQPSVQTLPPDLMVAPSDAPMQECEETPFSCPRCECCFKTCQDLELHLSDHHDQPLNLSSFRCSECKESDPSIFGSNQLCTKCRERQETKVKDVIKIPGYEDKQDYRSPEQAVDTILKKESVSDQQNILPAKASSEGNVNYATKLKKAQDEFQQKLEKFESHHQEEVHNLVSSMKSSLDILTRDRQDLFEDAVKKACQDKDREIKKLKEIQHGADMEITIYKEREAAGAAREKQLEQQLNHKQQQLVATRQQLHTATQQLYHQQMLDKGSDILESASSSSDIEDPKVQLRMKDLESLIQMKDEEIKELKEVQQKRDASSPVSPSVSAQGKLSFTSSIHIGELALLCRDEKADQYVLFTIRGPVHFLHTECLEPLGLKPVLGEERKNWLVVQVTDKEYCQAKKANNRFGVPVGTKFYRVRAKKWDQEEAPLASPSRSPTPPAKSPTQI